MSARRFRWAMVLAMAVAVCWWLAPQAGAQIYWAEQSDYALGRAQLDGFVVVRDFINGANLPQRVAVDGSHIYWTNYPTGTIGRANIDGTGVIQNFITGAGHPEGVAVDGHHVYWADYGSGTIGRANIDGSGVDPSFITGASQPREVAVDGQHIYWANSSSDSIGRANIDGTRARQGFITGIPGVRGLAVNDDHIYWTSAAAGTIGRANLGGSDVNPSFITGANAPSGVAVDEVKIYWTNLGWDTIGRANIDGSGVNQGFIDNAGGPFGIAVARPQEATPSPANLDFGSETINTVGPPQPLTVTNTGHADLHMGSVAIAGANPDDFMISSDGCSQAILAIGDSCTVGVRFAPSVTGARAATLSVPTDDPRGPLSVPLSGTGANPTQPLNVFKSGSGSGTVTSNPAGIDCGQTCWDWFDEGTAVTLTAKAAPGSTFDGWFGGGCSGTGTCQVTVSTTTAVSATFTKNPVPETTITAGPADTTHDPTPSFGFSSSVPGSSFQCKVDSGAFARCSSPRALPPLGDGAHTFAVRATAGGVTDPTPASRSFTVRTAAVGVSGGALTVTATAGVADDLKVTRPSATTLKVAAGSGIHAGPSCTRRDDVTAICTASGIASIKVLAGDGADRVVSATAIPSSLVGGPGADILTGGTGADRITGGDGADSIQGMGGNDVLLAHDLTTEKAIDCGGAGDSANVDQLPRDPAAILKGCESVDRH